MLTSEVSRNQDFLGSYIIVERNRDILSLDHPLSSINFLTEDFLNNRVEKLKMTYSYNTQSLSIQIRMLGEVLNIM